jgi:hypothetical protein
VEGSSTVPLFVHGKDLLKKLKRKGKGEEEAESIKEVL